MLSQRQQLEPTRLPQARPSAEHLAASGTVRQTPQPRRLAPEASGERPIGWRKRGWIRASTSRKARGSVGPDEGFVPEVDSRRKFQWSNGLCRRARWHRPREGCPWAFLI